MKGLAMVILRCVLLAVLLAPLLAVAAVAQDASAIAAQNDKLMATFNKGDAVALRALYTQDAFVLPAGGEMVRGKDLQPFWRAVVARIDNFKRSTVDLMPLGNEAAREIGVFSFRTKRELKETSGKYVVLWQRVDGDWKIATDIWNADK
ncbi:MAG TPA: nuclear transport factor 2 family protein [Stellaceae bacterium]|nr:nuclear transport factor 2 family protein [Stellaceae bacterium]